MGHQGEVVYRRAFGERNVVGVREPMTLDTIFDIASLTKVVATTNAVMTMVEDGRLRLRDRVANHLPNFDRHGKGPITIEHLLTHTSGLRPDLPLEEIFIGADEAVARMLEELPEAAPGERFIYSDLNFMLLAEIVERVAEMPFEEFVRERVFEPLGMRDTMFLPPASLTSRIAPTEPCVPLAWPCGGPGAEMLRGRVHDPTARRMEGVAGAAGGCGVECRDRGPFASGTGKGHRRFKPGASEFHSVRGGGETRRGKKQSWQDWKSADHLWQLLSVRRRNQLRDMELSGFTPLAGIL